MLTKSASKTFVFGVSLEDYLKKGPTYTDPNKGPPAQLSYVMNDGCVLRLIVENITFLGALLCQDVLLQSNYWQGVYAGVEVGDDFNLKIGTYKACGQRINDGPGQYVNITVKTVEEQNN